MNKLTDAIAQIAQTAKAMLPSDATPAEVFIAVNVAINDHAASTLLDDTHFSQIMKSMYHMKYGIFTYVYESWIMAVPFLVSSFDDEGSALLQQQISEYRDGQQSFIRRNWL